MRLALLARLGLGDTVVADIVVIHSKLIQLGLGLDRGECVGLWGGEFIGLGDLCLVTI